MVTVHTITYNEEIMVEFFINHYRKLYPDCDIIIYDNESTDNTVHIAEQYNCKIIRYNTNNTLSDQTYLDIKNNCWKSSKTDWNIICDCDELIEVTYDDILSEEMTGVNLFRFEGYSMMNNTNNIDISNMKYGFRDVGYDKSYLFNKKFVNEINYFPGCHSCNPVPNGQYTINYSSKIYRALHYKYLSPNYTIDKHAKYGKRLSDDNKQKSWGIHYLFSSDSILSYYTETQKKLIKLL